MGMKLGIGTAGIFARSAAASHDEHLCRAKCAFRDRARFFGLAKIHGWKRSFVTRLLHAKQYESKLA